MPKSSLPDKSFWTILLIAVFCGLAAGIFGAVFSRIYVYPDYLSSSVDLSNLRANNSGLVIRDPKTVIVSSDVKVSETVNNLQPVLVGVFKKLATDSEDAYYRLNEPLFVGLVITADGWAIGQTPTGLDKILIQDYVAIASDKRIYELEKVSDLPGLPGQPFIFRLSGAANLPVKKILSRSELNLGTSLLVINGRESIWPTTLASLSKSSGLLSSDSLIASLSLSGIDANDWENSFVFDMAGNLAAVVTGDETVIPAFSYSSLLTDLALEKPLARPYLGLNYLDLSSARLTEVSLTRGALVYAAAGKPAVEKSSPAEKAGLVAGDIITWVNNNELGPDKDLADIISTYRAGDKIILTYRRDGLEKTVEITLGEKNKTN